MKTKRGNTSTILPLGRPPPKAKSNVIQPLGNVSLQCTKNVTKSMLKSKATSGPHEKKKSSTH